MFSRLVLGGVTISALCGACGSSSSGNASAGGGASGSAAGAAGSAADPVPRAGDDCRCQDTFRGSIECSSSGCACLCAQAECTTAGGLASTRICRERDCEACEPALARPKGDFALQHPAFDVAMGSDESTYVRFGGFPYLGHYETNGSLLTLSTDIAVNSGDWSNSIDLLVAADDTLYTSVIVRSLVADEPDGALILHSRADGQMLERTRAAVQVVTLSHLTQAPNGKLYATGRTAEGAFVAPMASNGSLGERMPIPEFGFFIGGFAADDSGNFAFSGGTYTSTAHRSRVAVLPVGTTAYVDLHAGANEIAGEIRVDASGGWWFSSGTKLGSSWTARLYHSGPTSELTQLAELSSPLTGGGDSLTLGSEFALLSDSMLLVNVNQTAVLKNAVGRFADGRLIQLVDSDNAYAVAAAGKRSATILTRIPDFDGPGIDQVDFEPRR